MKRYHALNPAYRPQVIILANGDFPTRGIARTLIESWAEGIITCPLVCCDGAATKLAQFTQRKPTAVVGDLDSLSPELKMQLQDRLYHLSEQVSNDLSKAMHYVSEVLGLRDITLLGASGGREDHLFANITLLPHFAPLVDELCMITDEGYFRLIRENCLIEAEPETPLSLFSIPPRPFSLSGVYWEVEDFITPHLWSASLNRTKAPCITLRTQAPLLVYLAHEPITRSEATESL